MDERWLPVPHYEELYEVSSLGQVRSLDRRVVVNMPGGYRTACGPTVRTYKSKTLKRWIRKDGYPEIVLSRDGTQTHFRVHILVLEAFTGPCPPGQEARHGPGGKLDASLTNLCWGTRADNAGPDRLRDGQDNRGEKHGRAILTREIVLAMRRRWAADERLCVLAAEYRVSKQQAWAVIHRKSWAWLSE